VHVLAELIGERNTSHPRGLELTRDYVRNELGAMSVHPTEQRFAINRRAAVNIEVAFPAMGRPEAPVLVVGAHYDSAPGTPGADDNASAVAILIEVVRALAAAHPQLPVRCVFYDCEEPPHFNAGEMGSQAHARRMRLEALPIAGMICLESLGYFVRRPRPQSDPPWYVRMLNCVVGGNNVLLVSNLRSIPFAARVAWAFARSGWFPFIPIALPRVAGAIELSDHRSYWDEGYPAVMFTNTALMRNPHYHQPTDRLTTLDLDRMTRLRHQMIACIMRLTCCA
jgi:hypothetical protein